MATTESLPQNLDIALVAIGAKSPAPAIAAVCAPSTSPMQVEVEGDALSGFEECLRTEPEPRRMTKVFPSKPKLKLKQKVKPVVTVSAPSVRDQGTGAASAPEPSSGVIDLTTCDSDGDSDEQQKRKSPSTSTVSTIVPKSTFAKRQEKLRKDWATKRAKVGGSNFLQQWSALARGQGGA